MDTNTILDVYENENGKFAKLSNRMIFISIACISIYIIFIVVDFLKSEWLTEPIRNVAVGICFAPVFLSILGLIFNLLSVNKKEENRLKQINYRGNGIILLLYVIMFSIVAIIVTVNF